MNETTKLSWNNILDGCEFVAEKIKLSRITLRLVVGIAKGGLIPAALLAQRLHIPMDVCFYSSKVGKGDDKKQINKLPSFLFPNILIVDEICDSGNTLKEITDYYLEREYIVHTAVLHHREHAVYTPTFQWKQLKIDDPWIDYPWEAFQA